VPLDLQVLIYHTLLDCHINNSAVYKIFSIINVESVSFHLSDFFAVMNKMYLVNFMDVINIEPPKFPGLV